MAPIEEETEVVTAVVAPAAEAVVAGDVAAAAQAAVAAAVSAAADTAEDATKAIILIDGLGVRARLAREPQT